MLDIIKKESEQKMTKTIESLKASLAKIRTGRAHPSILDGIKVDYYGNQSPLSQVSSIKVEDARTLVLVVWEKDMVSNIEKALINSDLGINPAVAGANIRIPMPPLTEERRMDFIKLVKSETEQTRVAIRTGGCFTEEGHHYFKFTSFMTHLGPGWKIDQQKIAQK